LQRFFYGLSLTYKNYPITARIPFFVSAGDSGKRLRKVKNKRNNLRYFFFGYYENGTKSLALMEAASLAF
jgi:hypothetical protein